MGADLNHVSNISQQVTSSLAILLQSKGTMFVLLLQLFMKNLITELLFLKSCEIGSEECVDCLTDLWTSRHEIYDKFKHANLYKPHTWTVIKQI